MHRRPQFFPHRGQCNNRLAGITTGLLLIISSLTRAQKAVSAEVAPGRNECISYQATISSGASLPDKLLGTDWRTAMHCMVRALDSLKSDIENKPTADTWAQFVRATGLIRIVIANNESIGGDEPGNPAIREFRIQATLNAASSLAYGSRSDNDNARVNAVLVYGNVVDNQTVCVAIDHLYDQQLGATAKSYNIRGRANLLGVVSVVAPWAYKENYLNIKSVRQYMADELAPLRERSDLKQTFDILENIRVRLQFQDDAEAKGQAVNKRISLSDPRIGLDKCKGYRKIWAEDRLKY